MKYMHYLVLLSMEQLQSFIGLYKAGNYEQAQQKLSEL